MGTYAKWGRSFVDSLIRHIGTSLTIWVGTELKYQEVNYHDLALFLVCGAIIPTMAEFFKQGLPPIDAIEDGKPQPKV